MTGRCRADIEPTLEAIEDSHDLFDDSYYLTPVQPIGRRFVRSPHSVYVLFSEARRRRIIDNCAQKDQQRETQAQEALTVTDDLRLDRLHALAQEIVAQRAEIDFPEAL